MNRREFAWALFDFANSAFPTVVSTFVIAAYFTQSVAPDPVTGQAQWGWMQTLAGIAIALLAPVLGAVADAGGRRRLMLLGSMLLCSVATASIWFVRPEATHTLLALAAVGVGTVTFEIGTVFYNAMLPEVAERHRLGRVSGLAWGLGYAGGLFCLAASLALVLPETPPFGLDAASSEPVRASAIIVAVWMLVFGWPVLLALPDPAAGGAPFLGRRRAPGSARGGDAAAPPGAGADAGTLRHRAAVLHGWAEHAVRLRRHLRRRRLWAVLRGRSWSSASR